MHNAVNRRIGYNTLIKKGNKKMMILPHNVALFFVFELLLALMAVVMIKLVRKTALLKQQTLQMETTAKIISNLRQNFDIQAIKNYSIKSIAEELKVDRCFLVEYDSMTKKFSKVTTEYLSSQKIASLKKGLPPIGINKMTNTCINNKKVTIEDTEKYIKKNHLDESAINNFYTKYNVKSTYIFPLRHEANILGGLVLHYCNKKTSLNKAQTEFVNKIGESLAVAINQAELYEKQVKNAEKEALLSNIINTIRSSIDPQKIQRNIVQEIGTQLKADRCGLAIYEKISQKFYITDKEYLSGPHMKSLAGIDINKELPDLREKMFNKEAIIVRTAKDYLKESGFANTYVEEHFKEWNIESGFAIPITYQDELMGALFIHYGKSGQKIGEEEIAFTKTIADQIGIGLYQSRLYENQKKTAQKEKVLRSFITDIRESLDITQIKHKIVTEVGKLFKADRVVILEFDEENQKYLPIQQEAEYLATPETKSIRKVALSVFQESKLLKSSREMGVDLIYPNVEEFLTINSEDNKEVQKFIRNHNIKSSILLNITHGGKFLGNLVLHYSSVRKTFFEDEIDYMKTIANQVANAIYQSNLFDNITKQAHKESILREIISKIKFTKSLEDAYKKLLGELSIIYKLKRVMFLESSTHNTNELIIKYEHLNKDKDECGNNLIFPKVCIDDFLRLINNFETLVIDNVMDCYPDDHTLMFFEKHRIKSLMAVPLVKYNGQTQVFGFIILCDETTRNWSKYEIQLLEAISESVISVLWEIAKFIEVEDLRNSFVLTLAHDFQVPLIGERNALEYIIQYNKEKLGKDAELLEEILSNNNNIINLLNKSVDIYNYESGKKDIYKEKTDVRILLKEVSEEMGNFAKAKEVKMELKLPTQPKFADIDRTEISKVLKTVIENAIEKSPKKAKVQIGISKTDKIVEIYIKDNGPGVSPEMQEKIFKRYEMALAIERKIGAGTGLFLAKRIMEAHKGSIRFETESSMGTIFYITLPNSSDETDEA